jgi:ribosomal-protein-alanine N-acetyltransferase
VIIRTGRLDLVPVELSDAQAVLNGVRQPDWALDYPSEGDIVIAGLIARNSTVRTDSYTHYKITFRAIGQVVGGCGFLGPPDATGSVEIGYGLVPSERGKGIATEAVKGLLEAAWKDPLVNLVVAFPDRDNEPSQGVLRRVGFQHIDSDSAQVRWEIKRQDS